MPCVVLSGTEYQGHCFLYRQFSRHALIAPKPASMGFPGEYRKGNKRPGRAPFRFINNPIALCVVSRAGMRIPEDSHAELSGIPGEERFWGRDNP